MPLFKIIDATRNRKGTIRASNLDEIINQAKEKLSLLVGENYKVFILLLSFFMSNISS